jgi:hypothetical protein
MATEDTIARLNKLEERVERIEKHFVNDDMPAISKPRKLSAKEFLLTKSPKSEVQKVLALAYFLEHQEGIESFNVSDLEATFRSAKEKLPKNLNDAVNKNIARGFMMEAKEKKDSKKAWLLTSTGERFVEEQAR